MEMSRQSELADALSTLDDSPSRPSVHRSQSDAVDARLAAAATAAVEWIPAAMRAAKQEAHGGFDDDDDDVFEATLDDLDLPDDPDDLALHTDE